MNYTGKKKHHNVYVVLLDKKVLNDKKFMAANPNHDPVKPCLYVGMTGLKPEERFLNHRKGYKSNRYVKKYGVKLLPYLYSHYNPMTYDKAVVMEETLAGKLRKRGYAVWQN